MRFDKKQINFSSNKKFNISLTLTKSQKYSKKDF